MELTVGSILFLIVMLLLFSAAWTNSVGAPWVPTPFKKVQTMLELTDLGSEDVLYDLGCGDGRTVVMAARKYGAKAVGIEIDPLRYVYCQVLISVLGLRDKVTIKYGNFFRHDLSDATVVTCYLLQETNIKLEQKLQQELVAGTRVVSNTFVFPSLRRIRQENNIQLYLV